MFELIKTKFTNVKPKIFVADFEASISVAIKQVFPDADEKGCSFHYGEAVIRKIRSPGIIILQFKIAIIKAEFFPDVTQPVRFTRNKFRP